MRTIATGGRGDDFSVKVWDIATGKLLKEFRNSDAAITSLAFDAGGQSLVVRNNDGLVRVFNVSTWESALTIHNVRTALLSQDGKSLLTADDQEIATWNCSSWSKIRSSPVWKGFPLVIAADTSAERLAVFQGRKLRIVSGSTGELIFERADFFLRTLRRSPPLRSSISTVQSCSQVLTAVCGSGTCRIVKSARPR